MGRLEAQAAPDASPPRGGRLSHEIQTPLNAILGNVELLLEGSAGPIGGEARRCLAEIQAAGHEVLRHGQLLLLLVQALETTRLHEEVEEMAPLLVGAWREARPAIVVEIAENARGSALLGDPFWLRTLASLTTEMAPPQAAGRLSVAVDTDSVITLRMQDADLVDLPATPARLMDAILALHGAGVSRSPGGSVVLSFPPARLRRMDMTRSEREF